MASATTKVSGTPTSSSVPQTQPSSSSFTSSSSAASSSCANTEEPEGFFYTAGPALFCGAAQAVLFNPIDRALYVRVKYRRSRFLDWRNFERPFQGFFNAAVYRTLVGASYMFWQDSARLAIRAGLPHYFQAEVSPQVNSMLIGLIAGSLNGFFLNALQAVKFRMWNSDEKGVTFIRTAQVMFKEAGVPIFFRGCFTTMIRDSVFGVVYETIRRATAWREFFDSHVRRWMHLLGGKPDPASCPLSLTSSSSSSQASADAGKPVLPVNELTTTAKDETEAPIEAVSKHKSGSTNDAQCGTCAFIANLTAALIASILSSPFNYVRSIVYGTPPGAISLSYGTLLRSFYTQVYYIYREGRSFTDAYAMPELCVTENRGPAPKKPSAATVSATASSSSASESLRSKGSSGGCGTRVEGAEHRSAAVSQPRLGRGRRLVGAVRGWSNRHGHHPIAAWSWANSRLNIGWGSLRVGVGMAMGQSVFHYTQDYVRRKRQHK